MHPIGIGIISGTLLLLSANALATEKPAAERFFKENPQLLRESIEFSDQMKREKPGLALLLGKLGLEHLHQLDPDRTYKLNLKSGKVTSEGPSDLDIDIVDTDMNASMMGHGVMRSGIRAIDLSIVGKAQTFIYCPFFGQMAEVSGFMASTVSRDPVAGIKEGVVEVDNMALTEVTADFSILAVAGGADNPQNNTVIDTAHYSVCGDDVEVKNILNFWPPAESPEPALIPRQAR